MTTEQERELLRRMTEESQRGVKIKLEMDSASAGALVATLQLALRHPNFKGPTSELAREFIAGMIGKFREYGLHATAEISELGNDPANDLPC